MKPTRNCCSAVCSGVTVVAEAAVAGVDGAKFGEGGGSKLVRSRLARFRTFTKSGRSLEERV